ncbi:MAG: hypothetical protein R3D59_16495 [Paracoccaceae bacterium]
MPTPKGYTLTQIALHWVVFLLVALQFILHDGISAAWRSFVREGTFEPSALVFSHIAFGILILLLVVWRMAISKAKRGAPDVAGERARLDEACRQPSRIRALCAPDRDGRQRRARLVRPAAVGRRGA